MNFDSIKAKASALYLKASVYAKANPIVVAGVVAVVIILIAI